MQETIKELTKLTPNLQKYTELDEEGKLIRQYEKINEIWRDVTEREKAKLELERAKQDLQKLYFK